MGTNDQAHNSPRKVSSAVLWAVLIVTLIAIAAAIYFVWLNQSSTDIGNSENHSNSNSNALANANTGTAGWNTYHDTIYSFSFKYPQEWRIEERTDGYDGNGPYVLLMIPKASDSRPYRVASVRQNWSQSQEIDRINLLDPPFTKVIDQSTRVLGDRSVATIRYKSTIGLEFSEYLVSDGNLLIVFNGLSSDVLLPQVIASFTQ